MKFYLNEKEIRRIMIVYVCCNCKHHGKYGLTSCAFIHNGDEHLCDHAKFLKKGINIK